MIEQTEKIRDFLMENDYCVVVKLIKGGCEIIIPERMILPCNGRALRITYRIGKSSIRQQGYYLSDSQKIKDVSYSLPLYAAPTFIYCDIMRMCVNINYSHSMILFLNKEGEEVDIENFVSSMDVPVTEENKNEFSEKSHQLGHIFMEAYKDSFEENSFENLSKAMGLEEGFFNLKGIFWEVLGQ